MYRCDFLRYHHIQGLKDSTKNRFSIRRKKENAHGEKKLLTAEKRKRSRRKEIGQGKKEIAQAEKKLVTLKMAFRILWSHAAIRETRPNLSHFSFDRARGPGFLICRERFLFAVSDFISPWAISFRRDRFLFSVSNFSSPWATSFRREQFLFAVSNFFLAVTNFLSPWAISFCREQFLFAVTVMGHRRRTHFKPTEKFQCTFFTTFQPPGAKKGFVKGEALRLLKSLNGTLAFFNETKQRNESCPS